MKKLKIITKNYTECWKFFVETRWYVVLSLGIFALFFLIGFAFPIFFREEIFAFMAELVRLLEGKSAIDLIFYIFFNNLKASFFAMVLGVGFGIFSLLIGIVNGYILGFVSREVVMKEGIFVLWRLFPHGIFELPAIIFSIGIGLKISFELFGRNKKKRLRYNFKEAGRFFLLVILPLLIIAAIIEGLLVSLGS